MPRLSLWRENKGNDYKFFDRRISEMFTIGGTDVYIHKYLGPADTGFVNNTEPGYTSDSIRNVQDLLFLENRDRKYDPDVYTMRTIYRINDNDFDLTQFGLFLTGDTMFMVFHLNDMIETFGRKIMVGDVMELPHLKDYYPLDDDLPAALKRYYVVQDATKAAEGFAPTWYPHLWRVKVAPLVDSQEYKDILNQIKVDAPEGDPTTGNISLGSISSIISKYQTINDAFLKEAEANVPFSGYDISHLYIKPTTVDGFAGDPVGITTDITVITSDTAIIGTDADILSPDDTVHGWLTGDGQAPNGLPVATGVTFPAAPLVGDYALRTDYLPNRLFRWDGRRWVKIEDNVRTTLTLGANNLTQRSSFVNNTDTFTNNSGNVAIRQSLSQALKPKADN